MVFALLFMGVTAFIVYNGVEGGIERVSRYMMPILLVLVVVIAGYSLTLHHTGADGETRTGVQGFLYYLTPHFEGLTVSRFLQILLDAMSQLFFSLSVSMGIMITYGSYVKDDVDLNKAVNQIEIFDTGVALLAGAMIIPAVYVFSGTEGMSAGPSLMFISLPKVFAAMGKAGTVVGLLFFITTIFATLTSCISVLESITANCMEIFHTSRKRTVLVLTVIYLAASAVIALGYSVFYFEVKLPNGFGRPDAGHYGLHQQQRYDAIDCAAVHGSDWLDQNAGLCHWRDGAQRRDIPPQKALYHYDTLCCPGYDAVLFMQSTGILA